MGAWFANFLDKSGYRIIISDTNKHAVKELAKRKGYLFLDYPELAIQPAQFVVLATPTHVTGKLLQEIGPHLPKRSVLVEISSVKQPIRKTLQKMNKRGVSILSIHPMFGPGVTTLQGRTIITTMIPRHNVRAQEFLSLFRKKGARIFRSSFDEHDKYISLTLSLPHFVNFAIAQTLRTTGSAPRDLRARAGSTFNLQLLIAEALYQESFGNEISIMMDNKHSLKAQKTFMRECSKILSLLNKHAQTRLVRELSKGQTYLRSDRYFSMAYERFNAALQASTT